MILIDTSAWIQHFRVGHRAVSELLYQERAAASDIVLLELIPFLHQEKSTSEKAVLITKFLKQIIHITDEINAGDWESLIAYQKIFLKKGVHGIAIPDIMIAYRCLKMDIPLLTLDKTLKKAAQMMGVRLHR